MIDAFKAVFWSFFGVRKRSDYDADEPAANGRSGLTQPAARSGWRRNGGDDV